MSRTYIPFVTWQCRRCKSTGMVSYAAEDSDRTLIWRVETDHQVQSPECAQLPRALENLEYERTR